MSKTDQLVPFGKLLNVIETAGFKLEYHYEDLVFIDNTAMIFRFDLEDYETVYLHFNEDCAKDAREQLLPFMLNLAKNEKLKLEANSDFKMTPKEGTEELQITF